MIEIEKLPSVPSTEGMTPAKREASYAEWLANLGLLAKNDNCIAVALELIEKLLNEMERRSDLLSDLDEHRNSCRHYLLSVEPKNLTIEDCLIALGYTSEGL